MSNTPAGIAEPSKAAIRAARRRASGAPRVGMPSKIVSAAPAVFSRI
jgi:hypothetical protein